MRKWLKISLIIIISIFVLLILITLIIPGGRLVWKEVVIIPILKPFSEPCGYSNSLMGGNMISCSCDGILFDHVKIGATSTHCLGQCGECKCYKRDWPNYPEMKKVELTDVDCSTLSKLSWAFSKQ
jgi:hypothetical protein